MSDLIDRQFEEIVVEYPKITDKEHKGKPYYSIKYIENGEDKIIGFGTYKIEVLSRYIRDYFIQSVQPDKDLIHLQKEQAYMQGYEDGKKSRKGKWTRHFDGNEWYWYCSSCKEQWYEEDLWMGGNSFPNFCPNCGCRMEEGDSDER